MGTRYNYNYAQTVMMKMFPARPDYPNSRSKVVLNFEDALEIIRCI